MATATLVLLGAGAVHATQADPHLASVTRSGSELIESAPSEVAVEVPLPGHVTEWTMTATNITDVAVPLWVEISALDGALFAGSTPLELTLNGPDGTAVLRPGDSADGALRLPDLPAGESYELHGVAELPRAAGNEYERADGVLTVRFTAELEVSSGVLAADPDEAAPAATPGTDRLPWTGANPSTVIALAAALVGAGTTAVVARRRTRQSQEAHS